MRSKVLKIMRRDPPRLLPLPPCGGGSGWGGGSAWLARQRSGRGKIPPTLPSPARGEGQDLRCRQPSPRRRQLGDRGLGGELLLGAGGAVLELDRAGGEAARTDCELPGQADEIHSGEFGPRGFVAVVVERV